MVAIWGVAVRPWRCARQWSRMMFLLVLCFSLFFTLVACTIVEDLLYGGDDVLFNSLHPSCLSPTEWTQMMDFLLDLIDREILLHIRAGDKTAAFDIFSKRMPLLFPESHIFVGGFKTLPSSRVVIKGYCVKPGDVVEDGCTICTF